MADNSKFGFKNMGHMSASAVVAVLSVVRVVKDKSRVLLQAKPLQFFLTQKTEVCPHSWIGSHNKRAKTR